MNNEKLIAKDDTTLQTNIGKIDFIVAMFATILINQLYIPLYFVFSSIIAMRQSENIVFTIVLTLLYVMYTLIGVFLLITLQCLLSRKMKHGVYGKHKFTLSDEGLLEETEFNRTLHKWKAIDKVVQVFGIVLLRVSGNSWHIFPRRTFASNIERERFKSELKQRINGDF